jgi:hypothetical protein
MTIDYSKNPSSPAPAISLTKMEATAPGLVDLYKHAGVSLAKRGLSGQRAAVYLVLDRSGSMGGYYRDGSVQHLAEQALGLSAQLDDDGIVPVVFFDHGVYPPVDVALTAYQGLIARENARLGSMGGTAYAPAMRAVIDHYQASGATAPAFVIFQTDGEPGDDRETERILKNASNLPIFWQFVGFGRSFRFLSKLDTLRGRTVDNAGFFAAGADPSMLSDSVLYDQLMGEFPQWLAAAHAAGIR